MYHGSIVPERLPLPIIRALSLMPKKVHLTVLGYESAWQEGYVNELRRYAASLGVADQLKIVEPLPRSEMMIHGQACDVGICLMPLASQDVNFRYMTGASNKPFDYLACGMALLTSDLADWKKMYVESGYGLACDPGNPESIAAELRWFFDHPAETRAMGERGRQRILSEWNYNNQFMPVMQKLTQEGHAK